MIPERFRSEHLEDVGDFGRTGKTQRHQGKLGVVYGVRATGEEFPLEAAISQVEVNGTKFFTAILHDITERMRAEEDLQRSLEKAERSRRLIRALSEAGNAVQSAHTSAQICQAILDGLSGLGYRAAILLALPDDPDHVMVSYLSYPVKAMEIIEKMIGVTSKGFRLLVAPGGLFDRVLRTGEANFSLADISLYENILPKTLRPLAGKIQKVLGIKAGIMARLTRGNETYGLLSVVGDDLSEADLPAMTTFATQASIALDNLRLLETVRQKEEHFRSLVEQLPAVTYQDIAENNPGDFVTAFVSPQVETLMGYPAESFISDSGLWNRLIHPDDHDRVVKRNAEHYATRQPDRIEYRMITRNGEVIWVRDESIILISEDGEKLISQGVVFDITEQKQADEALQASEARYRGLFEDSPIALWEEDFSAVKRRLDALRDEGITDFEQYFISHREAVTELTGLIKVLDVNKATMRIFGAERKEDIITNLSEIFNVDPIQDFHTEFINIAEGKTRFSWEGSNRTIDGRLINIALNWSVAPGYEESLSRVIVSMIDVTERNQAKDMLVAERDLLDSLINTLPDSIFIKDLEGRIVVDNDAHRRTLGAKTLEQVVGKTDFDFHLRERAAEYDADEKRVIQSGQPLIDKVSAFTYKDRSQRWFLTTKVPLRDRQGNITGIVGFNHDITERKLMEEQLLNERNLLRTLIDNLPDVVYAKDIEGRFIIKNLLDARQMGASSPEETIGKTDFDYYSPELAAQYHADDQAVFRSGQPIVNREEPIVDATGRSGWVLTTKVPLRDPQGKVFGLVGIGRDITERRQAEERIKKQLERLAALRTIDQVITSSFDLHTSLTLILDQVAKELGVDAADVLLLNSANLFLEYSAGVGFRTRAAEKASVRMGQSYAGRVALDRQLIQIADLKDPSNKLILRTQLEDEDFIAYIGVPLVAKGSIKGVLEVFHRTPLQPDQEWLDFLNTLAGQAALAIDNAQLFENLQRSNIDLTLAYDATIEGWSHAMDLRDKETEGHTLRVTEMTMELAGLFRIRDEDLVNVRRGTLLHDIGKMGIPDSILLKPAALTDEEWVIMRRHPTLAFELLSSIGYLRSAIDIPYCHHERWDGTGYPRGLKGEQIPLPARIFAVVDVWDALTSDRPYRKAWPREKAIEYIKSQAGKHFDPQIVDVCLQSGVFDRKARK